MFGRVMPVWRSKLREAVHLVGFKLGETLVPVQTYARKRSLQVCLRRCRHADVYRLGALAPLVKGETAM